MGLEIQWFTYDKYDVTFFTLVCGITKLDSTGPHMFK